MSNLWFNIRVLWFFIQSGPDKWVSFGVGRYWWQEKRKALRYPFGIYTFFGKHLK